MYSKAIIMGHLGREPELRTTKDGRPVASMNVAVSEGYGDKKKTTWYRVSVFGKQADSCHQYLVKGSIVLVDGSLSITEYVGKDGQKKMSAEIMADHVTFMPKSMQPQQPQVQPAAPSNTEFAGEYFEAPF